MATTIAIAVPLTLAGCGGGSHASADSTSKLSAADRTACDTLNDSSNPDADPQALYNAFGLNGSVRGMSKNLAPYAQLVGSDAQLLLSGADDGKLGEYVGQMRGVCETMGWRATP